MTKFPADFIWGTATSSFQIEGATREGGRSDSIWDTFCKVPGAVVNGETGDVACDHYHRYKDDIELLSKLGVDAYRFSCAWSRIIPTGTGAANQAGLDFYNRLIDELLAKGIEPWLTLYHWDLPQVLQDKGGWTNRDIVKWFEDYAVTVVNSVGDRVSKYMILNEPSVMAFQGHLEGSHAPGMKDRKAYAACAHHQNMVIGNTYSVLKAINPEWTVGSAYTHFPIRAITDTPENQKARVMMDAIWNRSFYDPLFKGTYPDVLAQDFAPFIKAGDIEIIRKPIDFIGIQHYCPSYAQSLPGTLLEAGFVAPPAGSKVTDMGWAVDPEGFHETLTEMKTMYGNPVVVITENGAAYADQKLADGSVDDQHRVQHYHDYLTQVHRAIQQGCDIRGYFAWSFMDNFEWAWGYDKRFGLVYVDYKNLERTPKTSYNWYAQVIENNGLCEDTALKKCV